MRDDRLSRPNPNPRIVELLNYALAEVVLRLRGDEYADWLSWAAAWKAGGRFPVTCVDVAHRCFEHKEDVVWHALGQLAWAGKEACYDGPKSGWLVIRYIADAMVAFGVTFPSDTTFILGAAGPLTSLPDPARNGAAPMLPLQPTS